ncbi:MAG: response regulator [Myxococcota bacterium]
MPRILVVDDSSTMRKIIMKGLKEAGLGELEFAEAGDGNEGLEALSKAAFDLVLSDVNMPNMNGIRFVKCVRDQTQLATTTVGDKELIKKIANSIPIVMITTEGGLEAVQEALAAGANDYLNKPFTAEQLREKLGPYLS